MNRSDEQRYRLQEHSVAFRSGAHTLEGLAHDSNGSRAVVVAHPHPLYGGDMHNNVVVTLVETYAAAGYRTLRFNFRGVGASEGSYDEGKGEQQDIQAAVNYVRERGATQIVVAGYSFGAWVIAQSLKGLTQVQGITMISPPVGFLDFGIPRPDERIGLVIVGDHDDFALVDTVRKYAASWNSDAQCTVIPGANHFYSAHSADIRTVLGTYLAR